MNSALQQKTHMEQPAIVSLHICTPGLSPQTIECHACDARGGCLADQMMDSHERSDLVQHNSKTYKQGEHIFREGDESKALYVVRSGSVKSYLTTEDGEEQVLGFYLPGDAAGLDGVEDKPRSSSAIALETTSICKLPFSLLSDRGRGRGYPRLVADQLSRDHNLVLMLARKDADGRLASFICDLSRRFEINGYSSSAFNLTMSRQDIGSYLGLAIETVSRTLTRFQESGLLEVRRRKLEIKNHDALQKVAGAQAAT